MNDTIWFIIPPVLLLLLVIYVVSRLTGLNKEYYQKRWRRIQKLSHEGGLGLTVAVIEADKLLDHALKAKKFGGKNMGERLKNAKPSLHNANAVWTAHKFRNKLVHEDVVPSNKQVKQALAAFEAELKKLGAL